MAWQIAAPGHGRQPSRHCRPGGAGVPTCTSDGVPNVPGTAHRRNRISSSGHGRPDGCNLDQHSWPVPREAFCTAVNCN